MSRPTITENCRLVAEGPLQQEISANVLETGLRRLNSIGTRGAGLVLVNKPIYRLVALEIADGRLGADFAVDTFANYALTMDLLEDEVLAAGVHVGGPAPVGKIESGLPLRDELLPDALSLTAFDRRLCAGGPIALLAIARRATTTRPADFLIVIQKRSDRVLNARGRLSVIPKGFHQHMVNAQDEVSIGASLHRELEEEVFGRQDFDEEHGRGILALNPFHQSRLTEPMKYLIDRDGYAAECLGFGINLVSGNYEFPCLITVTDEDFWDEFGGACVPNWEANDIQVYSTSDVQSLGHLMRDPGWSNEGLFALAEGLGRLAVQHPERVPQAPVRLAG